MSVDKYNNEQLYLGVDGGGSKCRVIIFSDDQGQLAEATSGPANVLRGVDNAIANILQATDEALQQLNLPESYKSELIAGIGLAGLNLDSCMAEIKLWQHPFKQAFFTSDLHIACIGAHKGQDGAVMIVGTGSSALISYGGHIDEFGGHGFPIGDSGSGAWLGLRAIEHTLLVMDGVEQETGLSKKIESIFSVARAIDLAQVVAHFVPADFAKLAPAVMELANHGDEQALYYVSQGARYLSRIAMRMLEKNSVNLAMIGGLSPLMVKFFDPEIQQRIIAAELPPEIGAVLFAKQHLTK
jgi:glucosamine kinase